MVFKIIRSRMMKRILATSVKTMISLGISSV